MRGAVDGGRTGSMPGLACRIERRADLARRFFVPWQAREHNVDNPRGLTSTRSQSPSAQELAPGAHRADAVFKWLYFVSNISQKL